MKTTFFVILFVIFNSMCSSQLIRSYGIIGGYVSSDQSWDYTLDFHLNHERRAGVDVGIFIEWLNMPILCISTELNYNQKGFKLSAPLTTETHPDGTGEILTLTPHADYISIPILAKVRVLDSQVSPYMVCGPRVDFLINTNAQYFDLVFDEFKRIDLGMTLGAGVELNNITPLKLGAEFRFNPNLTDSYTNPNLKVRNSTFSLLLFVGI